MFNTVYNLGSFPVFCPNCKAEQPYNLVDYPKEIVCQNCKHTFHLSKQENEEILCLFSAFLANNRPEAALKLKPLCLLLQKAVSEKKGYIRLYPIKDPAEGSSFPLLAVFAAHSDKEEDYSYIGSVKAW